MAPMSIIPLCLALVNSHSTYLISPSVTSSPEAKPQEMYVGRNTWDDTAAVAAHAHLRVCQDDRPASLHTPVTTRRLASQEPLHQGPHPQCALHLPKADSSLPTLLPLWSSYCSAIFSKSSPSGLSEWSPIPRQLPSLLC